MAVFLFSLLGNASIGVYTLANDKMVIVPSQVPVSTAERLGEWLGVKAIRTTIGGSVLVGALACANSNGVVLPHFVRREEIEAIQPALDSNVTVMETRRTAYGNLILANDRGALVDPRLKRKDMKRIEDALDVEVAAGEVAGLPYVGSLALATNKGVLAHPLLRESEEKVLANVLRVDVDVGTINCGIPYVATGLIGNTHSAIAGTITTGPELFIIGQALDVVEKSE
ncbi:MAG: translation initiation factor IF-6 [Candidatus Bathyarchaeota archaeon]|nr:MAG: translation initiation factor IF-6 [Candidatus Bathyarchaeota archaeon]